MGRYGATDDMLLLFGQFQVGDSSAKRELWLPKNIDRKSSSLHKVNCSWAAWIYAMSSLNEQEAAQDLGMPYRSLEKPPH